MTLSLPASHRVQIHLEVSGSEPCEESGQNCILSVRLAEMLKRFRKSYLIYSRLYDLT